VESTQGVVAPMDMDDDRARARDAASSVNCATERDADGRSVRVKRQMHMMMDRRAVPCLSLFSCEVMDTTSHSLAKAPSFFLASPVTRGHSQCSSTLPLPAVSSTRQGRRVVLTVTARSHTP
jgi:hypothetical protein